MSFEFPIARIFWHKNWSSSKTSCTTKKKITKSFCMMKYVQLLKKSEIDASYKTLQCPETKLETSLTIMMIMIIVIIWSAALAPSRSRKTAIIQLIAVQSNSEGWESFWKWALKRIKRQLILALPFWGKGGCKKQLHLLGYMQTNFLHALFNLSACKQKLSYKL